MALKAIPTVHTLLFAMLAIMPAHLVPCLEKEGGSSLEGGCIFSKIKLKKEKGIVHTLVYIDVIIKTAPLRLQYLN